MALKISLGIEPKFDSILNLVDKFRISAIYALKISPITKLALLRNWKKGSKYR